MRIFISGVSSLAFLADVSAVASSSSPVAPPFSWDSSFSPSSEVFSSFLFVFSSISPIFVGWIRRILALGLVSSFSTLAARFSPAFCSSATFSIG
jgi:hypothetical protein